MILITFEKFESYVYPGIAKVKMIVAILMMHLPFSLHIYCELTFLYHSCSLSAKVVHSHMTMGCVRLSLTLFLMFIFALGFSLSKSSCGQHIVVECLSNKLILSLQLWLKSF